MTQPLRLLLVTQYFHPEVGATQTRMWQFAKHLVRLGHEVTVICEFPNHPHGVIPPEYDGRWIERDHLEGFDIIRVRVKASSEKNFRTRLLFYLSFMGMGVLGGMTVRGGIDAVIVTSPPLPAALGGWLLSALHRAPLVLDIRDLWPQAAVALGELSNPLAIRAATIVEEFLYRRSRTIVTVTKGFVEHISPRCGDASKLSLIPNGTITELFNPGRTDPSLREKLGLDGKFVCCFAGNMGIAQGLPFLLDLAVSLRSHPDIRFLLIGSGPVRATLEERIEREQITNVLLHDPVPLSEAANYLTMSDLLLVPLRADPVFKTFIPSKMFDCLACGRPIVLGVDGEARLLLEENGGGLFVTPEDIGSYRDAILKLYEDDSLRDEMAARGLEWVTRDYRRVDQAEKLERLLRAGVGRA